MPIPEPKSQEVEKDFIDRCMSDNVMEKEFPNNKQRVAVCYSEWNRRKRK